MKLKPAHHLAYCTNVFPGESWPETFHALQTHIPALREQLAPGQPFGIGLRLGAHAARELNTPAALRAFRHWLEGEHCYVFSLNGAVAGPFRGQPVKEQSFKPDWLARERLDYTNLLFDVLAHLVPPGVRGSVNTIPGAFKPAISTPEEVKAIRDHVWQCVEHVARVSETTERHLQLGLELEPCGLLENSRDTLYFFDRLRAEHPHDHRLEQHLGVTYDTAHLAVEFEDPRALLGLLQQHQIPVVKIQFSNALKVRPTPEALEALRLFVENTHLHQVALPSASRKLRVLPDLPLAFDQLSALRVQPSEEWRVHYRVPLHTEPSEVFGTTADHTHGVLDVLQARPGLCDHLEIETHTWDILPAGMKTERVEDQILAEYAWLLGELQRRGLA